MGVCVGVCLGEFPYRNDNLVMWLLYARLLHVQPCVTMGLDDNLVKSLQITCDHFYNLVTSLIN